MQQITIPQMKQIIKHTAINKRRPVYFHGASGIGKSEGVHQSAEDERAVMLDIRVSQYESIDFRGIPDIQQGATVWNMPATLPFKGNPKFIEDDGSLIYMFLDEINQGDPSVLSVLYQLINDRRVGEHVLMDNVIIICAGNREQDRGTTNRFPAPLANRMKHFELVPSIKAWTGWAAGAGVDSRLIGFLNFRPELLHTFDPAKPEIVFATPRTWQFVDEDLKDGDQPADVRIACMSGSVGEGPATELQGFIDIMDALVPIEQIIADPKGTPVEHRLDLQWAMATHISGNMDAKNVEPLHTYLARMDPEMVVLAWTLALQRDDEIAMTPTFATDYAPAYIGMFRD
jgi:hypothetical protein